MISPELLRRYPFFSRLTEAQLREIAMISEEIAVEQGAVVISECQPANFLYLLETGGCELLFSVKEEYHPERDKEFIVGDINPGEPFGISAVLEPYTYTSSARMTLPSKVLKIEAKALRNLMQNDLGMAYQIMVHTAQAAYERLHNARVLLAAV